MSEKTTAIIDNGKNNTYINLDTEGFDIGMIANGENTFVANAKHKSNVDNNMQKNNYISQDVINELSTIKRKDIDLTTLIELCNSINFNYSNGKNLATIILLRIILDHIPPIFNKSEFQQVLSNHSFGDSNKKTISRLSGIKDICDKYIHQQISHKELLPSNESLIVYCPSFEILLQEIIKLLNKEDYKIVEIKKDIVQKEGKKTEDENINKKPFGIYAGIENVLEMNWEVYTSSYGIAVDGPFCASNINGKECNYKLDFKIDGLGEGDPYSFSYYECLDCNFKSQEFSEIKEEKIKEKVIKKLEAKQRRGELVNIDSYV